MANQAHVDLLRQGVKVWNKWKSENPSVESDLRSVELSGANLSYANFIGANLSRANLSRTNLSRANLSYVNLMGASLSRARLIGTNLIGANLGNANLIGTNLSRANLSRANLSRVNLRDADLSEANLIGADLSWADLSGAKLMGANLMGANLMEANLGRASLIGADLSEVDLSGAKLSRAKLSRADLDRAKLIGANLSGADLSYANLIRVNLNDANLIGANLIGANLSEAKLNYASLIGADLSEADLSEAQLMDAKLIGAKLSSGVLDGVNITRALIGRTTFSNVDLSTVRGIGDVRHLGPSTIGIDTLYRSGESIPEVFLRGCGVPEALITYYKSLVAKPIEFYSCFISYSRKDKSFAQRLHNDLQAKGIRCWLDEKQLKPGDDLYEQIERGIRLWDKVLLCASKHSLTSWWVDAEIDSAFAKEQQLMKKRKEKVLALIPLNLDGYMFKGRWKNGKAEQVKSRLAADFTGWDKNNAIFEEQFEQVVKALRADAEERETPPASLL